MIAKRRVDFVTGNINSYARILNGPAQLEKIKTYNQLAASIAELQRDREERKKAARAKKQEQLEERMKNAAEKERKAKDTRDRLLPLCREHVAKGLEHVLSLNLKNSSTSSETDKPDKMQILKHVFGHSEAKTGLKKGRADQILTELIGPAESEPCVEASDEALEGDGGDVMAFPLPPLPGNLV